MRGLKIIFWVVLLLAAPVARAAFHFWAMSEIFSNADGSVQFLELRALTGGQQFVGGHMLVVTSGGVSRSFSFPGDLPGDTNNRRMLIATQGFAALNVVTPDFVVPNGFFFQGGGTIDFAEGADVWTHPALPTDGSSSLDRTGLSAVNSPTNFAGQSGRVTVAAPPPALNFQALWWKAPADSESGWGLNITHQGNILFATWFTYDTDGRGMWLVLSEGRLAGANTYSGTLFRTTGPPFSSASFSPALVTATPVGSATLTFSDANSGSFLYTVNGITQTRAIVRQVYSSPVPTCAADPGGASSTNFQDLWWRSPAGSESGWGVNITHQGDILFATWFTYASDGRGMWLVMSDGRKTATNTYSGALYRTTGPAFSASPWSASQVAVTQVGTGTFTFTDAGNGTFAYTVDGVTQSKPITRQVYSSPVTVCR